MDGRQGERVKRWVVGATWPNDEVIAWVGGGGNMEELWATSLWQVWAILGQLNLIILIGNFAP